MSGRGLGKAGIGFSLIGILAVVVILGISAVIAIPSLTGNNGGSTTGTTTSVPAAAPPHGTTTETTGGIPSEAAVAACQADAATVATAVQDYQTLHGDSTPVTVTMLTSGSAPFLKTFPSSPDYTISIISGTVTIAAPKAASPVPYTTAGACARAGP